MVCKTVGGDCKEFATAVVSHRPIPVCYDTPIKRTPHPLDDLALNHSPQIEIPALVVATMQYEVITNRFMHWGDCGRATLKPDGLAMKGA